MEFKAFLKIREEASKAWVNGDAEPLEALLTQHQDSSFFGPDGGVVHGAKKVGATHRKGASMFASGKTKFQMIQWAAGDKVAYCVGIQRAVTKLVGKPGTAKFNLRVTEIFRRTRGNWELVHRHADMLGKGR